MTAARRDHVNRVIRPALEQGNVVLCDRFFPSTIAYQGYGGGILIENIDTITKIAIGDFEPDLTVLFFSDIELALSRAQKQRQEHRQGEEQRFVPKDMEFFRRVSAGYASFFSIYNCERSKKYRSIEIRADKNIDHVTDELVWIIMDQFKNTHWGDKFVKHHIDR